LGSRGMSSEECRYPTDDTANGWRRQAPPARSFARRGSGSAATAPSTKVHRRTGSSKRKEESRRLPASRQPVRRGGPICRRSPHLDFGSSEVREVQRYDYAWTPNAAHRPSVRIEAGQMVATRDRNSAEHSRSPRGSCMEAADSRRMQQQVERRGSITADSRRGLFPRRAPKPGSPFRLSHQNPPSNACESLCFACGEKSGAAAAFVSVERGGAEGRRVFETWGKTELSDRRARSPRRTSGSNVAYDCGSPTAQFPPLEETPHRHDAEDGSRRRGFSPSASTRSHQRITRAEHATPRFCRRANRRFAATEGRLTVSTSRPATGRPSSRRAPPVRIVMDVST